MSRPILASYGGAWIPTFQSRPGERSSAFFRVRQPLVGNPVTLVAEADRLHVVKVPVEVTAVRHNPFLEGCFGDPRALPQLAARRPRSAHRRGPGRGIGGLDWSRVPIALRGMDSPPAARSPEVVDRFTTNKGPRRVNAVKVTALAVRSSQARCRVVHSRCNLRTCLVFSARWQVSLLKKSSGDAERRGNQQELQKLEHSIS